VLIAKTVSRHNHCPAYILIDPGSVRETTNAARHLGSIGSDVGGPGILLVGAGSEHRLQKVVVKVQATAGWERRCGRAGVWVALHPGVVVAIVTTVCVQKTRVVAAVEGRRSNAVQVDALAHASAHLVAAAANQQLSRLTTSRGRLALQAGPG